MSDLANSRKRAREPEWTLVFHDASALRSMVEAVNAVDVQRVTFQISRVTPTSTSYQLTTNTRDLPDTCCVTARLRIDTITFSAVEPPDDKIDFVLDADLLLCSLDNPSCSHGSVQIESHDDASIRVVMCDPDQRSCCHMSTLRTFADANSSEDSIIPIETKFVIDADLSKLRELLKKARKAKLEHLRIQIFLMDVRGRKVSVTQFSVGDDEMVCFTQQFCAEVTSSEDGSLMVKAMAEEGEGYSASVQDVEPDLDQSFAIGRVEAFLRTLPVRVVRMLLGPMRPMVVVHTLDHGSLAPTPSERAEEEEDDVSEIRFLIAPKLTEL